MIIIWGHWRDGFSVIGLGHITQCVSETAQGGSGVLGVPVTQLSRAEAGSMSRATTTMTHNMG